MSTTQDNVSILPVKSSLQGLYFISFGILALVLADSILSLLYQAHVYPTNEFVEAFIPNTIVNLFVGLPVLIISMWLTYKKRLMGLLFWPGAFFYILYNYLAYVLALPLSWAYLVHLLLVALSLYALAWWAAIIDPDTVMGKLKGQVPERLAGGILMGFGTLFVLRVLGVLGGAILSGNPIGEVELAVNISDFLTTPAYVIIGALLWRRRAFGYAGALGLLFQACMLFIGLIVFLLLQPVMTSAPLAVVDILVVALMGLIAFVPFVMFMRGTGER